MSCHSCHRIKMMGDKLGSNPAPPFNPPRGVWVRDQGIKFCVGGGCIFQSDQLEVGSGKVRNKTLNHLSVSLVLDTSDCNLFSAHSELECLKEQKKNNFDCDSINKQILFQFINIIYKKTIKTYCEPYMVNNWSVCLGEDHFCCGFVFCQSTTSHLKWLLSSSQHSLS